ncbi:MAG: hypothetical protein JO033_16535 [Acidobacteriaceae bacterium]|nr:hypothetical protein [Acidobacteriaceae bacterium]
MYCFFLVRASPAAAPYRFSSWTTENGLPQDSISALLQTRDGYLWMSTLDGLVRFDGLHFQVFNRQNTPAITGNSFTFFALLEDRQGCPWVGTLTGGAVGRRRKGLVADQRSDAGRRAGKRRSSSASGCPEFS